MKKFLLLAFAILMLSARLPAQSGITGNLNAASTDCSVTNSCLILTIPENVGGATIKLSGTWSATVQFETSADPLTVLPSAASWVAISATPSSSTTTVTAATANGAWQINVAGFRRIRIRVSAFTSGTVAGAINLSTASARNSPSAGGGGGGPIFDCSAMPGAPDMGAQLNACYAQGPSDGAIYDATHFTSPQTITTPVVQNVPGVTKFCAIQIDQKAPASITALSGGAWQGCPGRSAIFLQDFNGDQLTISGSKASVSGIDLEGQWFGANTGNGIVTGTGVFDISIDDVLSEGHANDEALIHSDTGTTISNSLLYNFGLHGVEVITHLSTTLINNDIEGFGSEAGSAIKGCGITAVTNAHILTGAAFPAIDDGGSCVFVNTIIGNRAIQAGNGGVGVAISGEGTLDGNFILSNGAPALTVTGIGAGSASNNDFSTAGAGVSSVVLSAANAYRFHDNLIGVNDSSGGACGLEITGDTVSLQAHHNTVDVTSAGTGTFGGCFISTSGHADVQVDGLTVNGFSHAGDAAWFTNNAGNMNTNWNLQVSHVSSTHMIFAYKRIDTQNNVTLYKDALLADGGLDAGTGSVNDNIQQQNLQFASLPTPAGSGSLIYNCTDCTHQTPTTGGGTGAFLTRVGTIWEGVRGVAATSFTTTDVSNASAGAAAPAQNATKLVSIYIPYNIFSLSNVFYHITTADNTANVYDFGLYGPNCLNSATNVPLVVHIGATAGTTFAPSINNIHLALSGAPVTTAIVPGWYCIAITSSGATPAAVMGNDSTTTHAVQFANGASPGGSTGTTSGGVLNSTITAPAAAFGNSATQWVVYY